MGIYRGTFQDPKDMQYLWRAYNDPMKRPVTLRRISSYTRNQSVAMRFSVLYAKTKPHGRSILFRFLPKYGGKAYDISAYSEFPGEDEVLVFRGARVRVTGWHKGYQTVIDLEEVV